MTIPINNIKKWETKEAMLDHCRHIISHSERYEKERVFEAKTLLDNEAILKVAVQPTTKACRH